jgi:hypothetical protein
MSEERLKEYRGVVWPKDDPAKAGERVVIFATSAEDAMKRLREQYGNEIVFTLANEEEENAPR